MKYGMSNYTPIRNMTPIENPDLRKIKMNETICRSAVESLLYLGICTRSDILYPVSKAAQKSKKPKYGILRKSGTDIEIPK
eukprot:jgi/Orpsp1_1/1183742/evm.model.c7180000086526.1